MGARLTDDAAFALFRVADLVDAPKSLAEASVERVEVSVEDAALQPRRYRPGPMTTLWLSGRRATTDSYGEYVEQREAIFAAEGKVLVHGLGLGAVLRPMLAMPGVESIDVVERSFAVCTMIGARFLGDPRVTIWHGDAYEAAERLDGWWDLVYSDIWVDDEDHSAEHARIREVYAGRCARHLCWRPS